MLDLGQYIIQLLLTHDCVIVPGFGGFVANYCDAVHDESTHTFSPPSKKILFNSSLSHNDGLLINHIAEQLNVSYSEAEQMVRQSVDDAWIELEKGTLLKINGIGSFSYNNDSAIVFEPHLTENLLTDSYGMFPFRFPPLSYQTTPEVIIKNDNIRKMPVIDTHKMLRYAAIIVPIAVLMGLIPVYRQHSQYSAGLPVSIPVPQSIEETISATNAEQSVDNAIEASTDKRTALFYNETPTTSTSVSRNKQTKGVYYIIGGSFKDHKNAEKHAKKYINAGFDSEIIQTDNLYRVTLGVYGDKVIALHELRRIRARDEYSNSWLYTKPQD